MASSDRPECRLLSIPYDIRYLIYQHLFPPGNQLYLQAWPKDFRVINTPNQHIPIALLRSCRRLHIEVSGYLYNHYLFNIIGAKSDCLTSYDRFAPTLEKYARERVHAHALGNGAHSAIMCISLHAGFDKVEVVKNRARGVVRRFEDVRAEVRAGRARSARWSKILNVGWIHVATTLMAVLVGVLAWMVAIRGSPR